MSDTTQEQLSPEVEEWDSNKFYTGLRILNGVLITRTEYPGFSYTLWHTALQQRFSLHPCVQRMVNDFQPKDFLQLAIEYPHVSEKDTSRLAYTRNAKDGDADRQLVTSIGKYLARHWPDVPDHVRRDVTAWYTPDQMYFVTTTPEIINAVENGPRSCMQSSYNSIRFEAARHKAQLDEWFREGMPEATEPKEIWALHPYSSYRHEHGWSMAVKKNGAGRIDGRGLMHTDAQGKKTFVRTYKRPDNPNEWSQTDHSLHAWLEFQGAVKRNSWPEGAVLVCPVHDGDHDYIRAPYVDGDQKGLIQVEGDQWAVCHDGGWTHWCECTSGIVNEREDPEYSDDDTFTCEDCGESYDNNECVGVGRDVDRSVCDDCCNSHYTEVHGSTRDYEPRRNYSVYYVHEDDAASIRHHDFCIDCNYPPEDVVSLEDGDWALQDDCVCIGDDWYLADDSRVCAWEEEDSYGDRYGLKEDSFKDDDGRWWADEDHYLEHNPAEDEDDEEDDPPLTPVIEVLTETA